jgi:hypothetical protein
VTEKKTIPEPRAKAPKSPESEGPNILEVNQPAKATTAPKIRKFAKVRIVEKKPEIVFAIEDKINITLP